MSEAIIHDYFHELTRFTVDTVRILLDFGAVKVDFSNNAEIIEPTSMIDRIDNVWEHQGHLQAIWRLLGRNMTGFVMDDDSFRLAFKDGAMIRCTNKKSYDFVTVWGPDPRCETGYPTALGTPDPKIMEGMRQMIEGPGPKLFFPFPLTPQFVQSLESLRAQRPIFVPPEPNPLVPRVVEGKAGKTITLDKVTEFFEFTVDPKTVTVKTSGLDVRFNHSFEVVDAAGRICESIDAKARTGDLDALWKLVRTNMARLEMDAESFRICFEDGSIIRSRNQLDVRRPDLEQVDYWLAADDGSNSPMPNDPQHYPANVVD
ncbi:MAG: hypothetical protein ACREDT_02435 [Methylocella sp.]